MPTGIVCDAPLRLGLAGGGGDFPPFDGVRPVEVVNAALDLRVTVTCELTQIEGLELVAVTGMETVRGLFDEVPAPLNLPIELRLACAAMQGFAVGSIGVRVTTCSPVSIGSGLGVSSSLAVCLVRAREWLDGKFRVPPHRVVRRAFELETVLLGERTGLQDYFPALFGGFLHLRFRDQMICSRMLRVDSGLIGLFDSRLFVASLVDDGGVSRGRSLINLAKPLASEHAYQRQISVDRFCQAFASGSRSELKDAFSISWELKSRTHSDRLSDNDVRLIDDCLGLGALGAKIAGAGSGGSMWCLVEKLASREVMHRIGEAGLQPQNVRSGSSVAGLRMRVF